MKISPVTNKRSYDSPLNENPSKQLRKLPHVFSKVLEMPIFSSDADVSIEDNQDNIRFITKIDGQVEDIANEIRAQAIEIHPGVTKIVVRNGDEDSELLLDQLKVDTCRFRLPYSAQPELATVVCVDGEFIVTVSIGGQRVSEDGRDVWRGTGQLVLVQ